MKDEAKLKAWTVFVDSLESNTMFNRDSFFAGYDAARPQWEAENARLLEVLQKSIEHFIPHNCPQAMNSASDEPCDICAILRMWRAALDRAAEEVKG